MNITRITNISLMEWIALFFTFGSLYYFLFDYQFSFNYNVLYNKQYSLLLINSIYLLSSSLVLIFSKASPYKFRLCLVGEFLLYFYSFYNAELEYIVVILTIMTVILALVKMRLDLIYCLFFFVFCFFLVEVSLGLKQLLQNESLTGSLKNSGIYSLYLSLHLFPMGLLIVRKYKFEKAILSNYLPAVFLLLLITIFLIVLTSSRTALLISVFSFIMIVFHRKAYIRSHDTNRKPYVRLAIVSGVLFAGSYYFYILSQQKSLSAKGRILMSKIALEHLNDFFWLGTGLGKFTWYYPQWQSAFFEHHTEISNQTKLVSGESYIILNEFLQLAETIGVPAFAILLSWFIFFLFSRKISAQPTLYYTTQVVISLILISALFTYPFHVNSILFLFSLVVVVRLKLRAKETPKIYGFLRLKIFLSLIVLASILAIYTSLRIVNINIAVWKWHSIRSSNQSLEQQHIELKKLLPVLNRDAKFLTDYASLSLDGASDTDSAIRMLLKVKKTYITREVIELLGRAYLKKKDFSNAIHYYTWIDNYIPCLFRPKYELLQLYLDIGKFQQARKIALEIIKTPVKVNSIEVYFYKKQAKDILEEYR